MDDLLLPLFPLDVVLLPQELLPLHIFEERYKQMIGECLEAKTASAGQQEFGILHLKGEELQTTGCTARIVNVTRKYSDGRMDILTVGSRRFEVLFTNEEKTYLRGGVAFFDDDPECDTPDDAEAERAIGLFRQAIQGLRKSSEIPVHLPRPYRHLSFRIAGSLPLDVDFKQELLALRNERERLGRMTQLIERLIAHVKLVEDARRKAGGNGNVGPSKS
jgi:Lon protease-like protein